MQETMDSTNWESKFFKPHEFRCKHTGRLLVSGELIRKLDHLREKLGKPVKITSGYRDKSHPAERDKLPNARSYHQKGMAADIAIGTHNKHDIIAFAIDVGFNGIGIALKRGFVHLDIRSQDQRTVFDY